MSSSRGRRRIRLLGDDERRLWAKVAETVDPLDPRAAARALAEATDEIAETPVVVPPPAALEELEPPPAAPRQRITVRPTGPTRRQPTGRLPVIHVKHFAESSHLPPAVVAPPSLERIDHRTKRRLRNGAVPIDDRLDLHGMTQEAAHSALRGFLMLARSRGARIVLVITGKGKPKPGADPHDRGILRRAVPHWLSDPSLRDWVIGFEEAHLAHGGAGAIYVRLRRPRGGEGTA